MAVRFDASTEAYTRNISLAPLTAFSVACWVKISVDRNALSAIWSLDNTFASAYALLQTNTDGTSLLYSDGPANRSIGSLAVDTWAFIGIAVNGANGVAVVQNAGSSSATVTTWSNGQASTNADILRIDNALFSNQFLNGCMAAFKIWTGAALSEAELHAEAGSYLPRRTTSLYAWYPFLTAETLDRSGNGRTLSGGSGATTEDGPPIPWRSGRRLIVFPDSAPPIDAEFTATLPAIGATATGEATAVGQLAATLPALDADITAHLGNNAQLDATLPPLAASLTGQLDVTGTFDATLPALTTDISGEAEANVVEVVLPPLTASLTGQLDITAQLAAALPPLAVTLEGETIPPHGDITITTPGPTRGWTASTPARAWAATTPARGWRARPPT